jgi:VWFA-related protein
MTTTRRFYVGSILLVLCLILTAQKPASGARQRNYTTDPPTQVTVPARPTTPLFRGKQGKQRSEIEFTPSSRTVTIKLRVQDPDGYFLPNIRRENFAVYEDGARQKIVTAEVEHAPVSVALLMELGGRYHTLNLALASEVPQIGRGLLDVIGRADRVAVFSYDSQLHTLADFNEGHQFLDQVFDRISVPQFSEANFYDALLGTLNRMGATPGRKAIIVISSGLDTFSKANFQQLLQSAEDAATPIYTIGLERIMEQQTAISGPQAPFSHIDWNEAEKNLEMLAKVSGGRAYVLESDVEIPAIYDDIMENLRLRYVVTYVSSNPATSGPPRNIRVELIDPKSGKPLQIRDSTGKTIMAKVFVQQTYSPNAATNSALGNGTGKWTHELDPSK